MIRKNFSPLNFSGHAWSILLISAVWLLTHWAGIAEPFSHAQEGPAVTLEKTSSVQPPKIREYDKQRKVFLKHSRSKDSKVQLAAIYNLCHLHWIVVSDPRLKTYDKMQSIRSSIAMRLNEWSRKQQRTQTSFQDGDFRLADDGVLERGVQRKTVDETGLEVASRMAGDELEAAMADSLSLASLFAGDVSGGPSQLFRYHGGRHGPPWDHAPELMELIKATIDPKAWAESGGTATMKYYQPALALVVRAPQKTHDELSELLMKLRFVSF